MRSIKAKSIQRQVWKYGKQKGLTNAHMRLVYQRAKRMYNETPRTERENFTIFV